MDANNSTKKKWSVKRIIGISIILILIFTGILVYNNFNRILSVALIQGFENSIISDVYELKFEKLRVNFFERSVRVFNVTLQPREKPLRDYPYINSSLRLTTERITLKNAGLISLLTTGKLNLESISIVNPEIELLLTGKKNRLFPLKDSTAVDTLAAPSSKHSLESFVLHEFHLVDANIHTINEGKEREFRIHKFSFSLFDLSVRQLEGMDSVSFARGELSIGTLAGKLHQGPLQSISFADYSVNVDSLAIQQTVDTVTYKFDELQGGLKKLDIQTADSLFHLAMESFDVSYRDQSIRLDGLSYKPNVSELQLQQKKAFQHTTFSGTVGRLNIIHLNFDSLLFRHKLFIDEIEVADVAAAVFKDKLKPIDKNRFPQYLGQTLMGIPMPLLIKEINGTNVQLISTERKPDSTYAKANINRATLQVKNITNLAPDQSLALRADAFLENKAHFNLALAFSYGKPQFSFEGRFEKFNLPDLNPLIQAYTPASITKGGTDELSFSGLAGPTDASGAMRFLYHELEIDLKLQQQAKWKSSVVAFAANTYLNSANPASVDLPPREVKFHISRDMNKGFVSVVLKSVLNGLKETMIMSKENRKAYHEAKKKGKQPSGK